MTTTAFYKKKILEKTNQGKQLRELTKKDIATAASCVAVSLSNKKSNPAAIHNEDSWWSAIEQLNKQVKDEQHE